MRVVISLTTILGREHLLVKTLASISRQTWYPDAIYLWIPQGQVPIPQLAQSFPDVNIMVGPDQGPAMKLLPTLTLETDPNTRIITVDDDVEYPSELVDKLVRSSALIPDHAIGFTGWNLDGWGSMSPEVAHMNDSFTSCVFFHPVQVLEGFRGIVYRRGFFADDIHDHARALQAFRYHDDILFSGYLASHEIVRSVRWYDSCPQPDFNPWKIHCQESGLHKTNNWYQLGVESWRYWADGNIKGICPPYPGLQSIQRLRISGYLWCVEELPRQNDGATLPQLKCQIVLDSTPWPFADFQFDEILIQDFQDIKHQTLRACVSESLRILKPGGTLKILLPKHPALSSLTQRDTGLDVNAYSFCQIFHDSSTCALTPDLPEDLFLSKVRLAIESEGAQVCVTLFAPPRRKP